MDNLLKFTLTLLTTLTGVSCYVSIGKCPDIKADKYASGQLTGVQYVSLSSHYLHDTKGDCWFVDFDKDTADDKSAGRGYAHFFKNSDNSLFRTERGTCQLRRDEDGIYDCVSNSGEKYIRLLLLVDQKFNLIWECQELENGRLEYAYVTSTKRLTQVERDRAQSRSVTALKNSGARVESFIEVGLGPYYCPVTKNDPENQLTGYAYYALKVQVN